MTIYNQATFDERPELLQGNVQIIACAGSGKTEFVSERIAIQIQKGIAQPSEVVALTFNDAAAEELKFRVRDKIKELMGRQPDIGDMYIGTIHAFAFKILQDFVPKYRGYDMLDEKSRKAFAASLQWRDGINIPVLYRGLRKRGFTYNSFFARANRNYWKSWTINAFLQDVDFYREESLTEEYIDSQTFKNSLGVYLDKLEERKFLDFSGILRLAVDYLEANPYIIEEIQSQYKFFTIDEYQDVNPIQEQLIRLVSGQRNVCVVGDDDQSIYQWRGAVTENIIKFTENYPNVSTYTLAINRRSHDKIIKCGADFIALNGANRLQKDIEANAAQSEPGDLYKICFERQEEEVQWIIEKIQALYGKAYLDKGEERKLKYSDMALLFRRRNDAIVYKDALEAAGINVIYSGMGGLMEAEEIVALLRLFRFIGNKVKEVETQDDSAALHNAIRQKFEITFEAFERLIDSIAAWCNTQNRLSLQLFYYKILSELGVSGISYHDDSADDVLLYNLGSFSQVISDFERSRTYLSKNNIVDFVEYVNTYISSDYDEGSTNANEGLIDAVKIMTMHGTKGLGFPVVFMPSMKGNATVARTRVTWLKADRIDFSRYGGSIVDERRLYYVAMTRAKKFLFLSSYRIKIGGVQRRRLHPFFDAIKEEYFITEATADPTVRNDCDVERVDSDVRFPTNYSELSYYLSCGYDYRMRFVYGFNPEIVQALGYGKQVHNLINMMHVDYERTGNIPTDAQIRAMVDDHFYLRYAATDQENILKNSCVNSLKSYVALWRQDFALAVKTEQNFEMDFGDKALINGSIDLLARSPQEEGLLEVIDFKTGKQQSHFEEKYTHQVVLYAIAAEEALLKKIDKAYLHYLDAEEARREEVEISTEKKEETKQKLEEAIDGIVSNEFSRCSIAEICSKCDWKLICPKNN